MDCTLSKPTRRDTGFLDRALLTASSQALDELDQAEAELRKPMQVQLTSYAPCSSKVNYLVQLICV